MAREAGEPPPLRYPCELGGARRGQRARSAHVEIETALGRRHLDVERLARALERFRDRPGGLDRAGEGGRQDRATINRHDVMRPQRREADLEHIALTATGMEHSAAAPLAV